MLPVPKWTTVVGTIAAHIWLSLNKTGAGRSIAAISPHLGLWLTAWSWCGAECVYLVGATQADPILTQLAVQQDTVVSKSRKARRRVAGLYCKVSVGKTSLRWAGENIWRSVVVRCFVL